MSNLKYTSFGLERKVEKISDFVEAINNRLKYDQEENNRKFFYLEEYLKEHKAIITDKIIAVEGDFMNVSRAIIEIRKRLEELENK